MERAPRAFPKREGATARFPDFAPLTAMRPGWGSGWVAFSSAPVVPATAALQALRTRDIVLPMSTAELISKLRALSPRERDRVVRAVMPVKKTAGRAAGSAKTARRKVTWPDIAALKRKIYGDRVLPNLVLLEREEMRY